MHAVLFCIASAAVGIQVGWEKMPDGGMVYIIQLDPQSLETLEDGRSLKSDIPPEAGNVRAYRIVIGNEKLPRDIPPMSQEPVTPSNPELKEAPPPVPKTFPADAAPALPLERQAVHIQTDKPVDVPPSSTGQNTKTLEPSKPWLPLTLTLLGLFASVGLNCFLGWVAWDSRRRIHAT